MTEHPIIKGVLLDELNVMTDNWNDPAEDYTENENKARLNAFNFLRNGEPLTDDGKEALAEALEEIEYCGFEQNTALSNHWKNAVIKLGIAVEVTQEQLDSVETTGGKKYWFKHKGVKYVGAKELDFYQD